jgi:hypothetical protein
VWVWVVTKLEALVYVLMCMRTCTVTKHRYLHMEFFSTLDFCAINALGGIRCWAADLSKARLAVLHHASERALARHTGITMLHNVTWVKLSLNHHPTRC